MKTKAELQQDALNLNMEVALLKEERDELAAEVDMQKWLLKVATDLQNKTEYRLGQMMGATFFLAIIPVIVFVFFPQVLP